MKAVVCGLGSIGKRHLNNLERLGFACEDVAIFRTRKGTSTFGDTVLAEHRDRHPICSTWDEVSKFQPEIALITNPTSLHVETALQAANIGCHLFIEKPLSNVLNSDRLQREVFEKGLVAMVCYNLRFHPLFQAFQDELEYGTVGDILSVQAEMAERVTLWHPWESHTTSYACRNDLGGGVILTQSHELDFLYALFGCPQWVFATGGSCGDLKMDVENMCQSILGFDGFSAMLSVDYFKKPPKRFLEVSGTKGRMVWNYFENKLSIIPLEGASRDVLEPYGFDRNQTFLDALGEFIDCVEFELQPSISLSDGEAVMRMAMATHTSLVTGQKCDV